MGETVYKVVTGTTPQWMSSVTSLGWLRIQYKVGEWVEPAYPVLAFDTLRHAEYFRRYNLVSVSRYRIWEAEAEGATRIGTLVRVNDLNSLSRAGIVLRDFWRGDFVPEHLQFEAPIGTVACTRIKIVKQAVFTGDLVELRSGRW